MNNRYQNANSPFIVVSFVIILCVLSIECAQKYYYTIIENVFNYIGGTLLHLMKYVTGSLKEK